MSGRTCVRVCPGCGSNAGKAQGRKWGFPLSNCRLCGTLYMEELPVPSAAQDYDAYYDEANLRVPDFIERRHDEIVAGFEPYRRSGRLLDVGCGAGAYLRAAARAGWTGVGVEVSKPAAESNRAAGFEVFNGELAAAQFPGGHFDVVVASEVLEHVAEPREMLREILRVLRPCGLLWATTPNGRGFSARALGLGWSAVAPPEHLHLFSRSAAESLLRELGFVRVHVVTEGCNPFEIVRALRSAPAPRVAPPPTRGKVSSPRRADAPRQGGGGDRVRSGYAVNAFLSGGGARRAVKDLANGVLRLCRLGDSLKLRAEKGG